MRTTAPPKGTIAMLSDDKVLNTPSDKKSEVHQESQHDKFLQNTTGEPASSNSSNSFFLAGVLEFLTANILDQAGKEAQDKHKKRIAPQHLETVIESIQQLHPLLDDTTSLLDEMVHIKDK
ncbi:histone H2A-Bbd type 1-like [Octodon degus]|uniref:Histone H2A-Bbd type 1-like n=1 Tax=Octodon degus TaxID=10160 RepID=A0A6P6DPF3_OCTDE|nr:histone H2A-Bbd type 1-like [Octodon degus]